VKRKASLDVVDLLAAILHNAPALPGAACVGQPELFDGADPAATETAIGLCRYRCPVLDRCAQWVDATPQDHVSGVLAGRLYKYDDASMTVGREALRGAS